MSDFVPEGYLTIRSAFNQALLHWFGEQIASTLKRLEEEHCPTTVDTKGDSVRSLLVESGSSGDLERKFEEACQEEVDETYRRLLNALYKGELTALYFSTVTLRDEPNSIRRAFWTSPAADEVIEKGTYFPFGRAQASHERRPSAQVLVREEELERFLAGEAIAPPPLAPPAEVSSANRPASSKKEIAPPEAAPELPPATRSSKGAKSQTDWEAVLIEAARYMYAKQDVGSQTELFAHLRTWLKRPDGGPSDSTMKLHVGPLWHAFKAIDDG